LSILEEAECLRKVPMFASIDKAKLKLLAFTSERLVLLAGESLFRQGDPPDAAYLILEGEVEVLVDGPDGPLQVNRIGRYEVVGDIAVLCDSPRTATIRALHRVVTLRIGREQFLRMLMEFPEMALALARALAQRLQNTTNLLTGRH